MQVRLTFTVGCEKIVTQEIKSTTIANIQEFKSTIAEDDSADSNTSDLNYGNANLKSKERIKT